MRAYDPTQPTIFIHIPKTAGVSVRTVFQNWFPGRLRTHYFNEAEGAPPKKNDLAEEHSSDMPLLIYGHFNRNRGFGVEDYYPEVQQFITILRDPLDMHMSRYFFTKKVSSQWKRKSDVDDIDITHHIREGHLNMLEHFPRKVTFENYKEIIEEYFVDIGLFQLLDESLRRIGQRLGKPVHDLAIPHLNASDRGQEVTEAEYARFRERWPLEFEIYDYVQGLNATG